MQCKWPEKGKPEEIHAKQQVRTSFSEQGLLFDGRELGQVQRYISFLQRSED
jgi:hypothetical protein